MIVFKRNKKKNTKIFIFFASEKKQLLELLLQRPRSHRMGSNVRLSSCQCHSQHLPPSSFSTLPQNFGEKSTREKKLTQKLLKVSSFQPKSSQWLFFWRLWMRKTRSNISQPSFLLRSYKLHLNGRWQSSKVIICASRPSYPWLNFWDSPKMLEEKMPTLLMLINSAGH